MRTQPTTTAPARLTQPTCAGCLQPLADGADHAACALPSPDNTPDAVAARRAMFAGFGWSVTA